MATLVRPKVVTDVYLEDLGGPVLPVWLEEYLAEQRAFWRTLRHGGVTDTPASSPSCV